MQKTTRTAAIDDQFRPEADRLALSRPLQPHATDFALGTAQFDLIEVIDAQTARLLHEEMVELSTIPMRIRHPINGTCPNHKLPLARRRGLKSPAERMLKKREAALQTAGDLRRLFLPRPPLAQRPHSIQPVISRKLFEEQIGQWC